MSSIIIFMILLLAVANLILNHRRTGQFLALMGFSLSLLVGSGLLSQFTFNSLQSYPSLKTPYWIKRNAILILRIGTTQWHGTSHISTHPLGYSRIYEGARLYFLCKKHSALCRVIRTYFRATFILKFGSPRLGSA